MMDQEIEVKFFLSDLSGFRKRLIEAGAVQTHPSVLETNLRFDTPGMDLRAKAQVLRLRQDQEVHLTFKGLGELVDGVLQRQEIEFEISDYHSCRRFLEALGYKVFVSYEKVRENFQFHGVQVSIDAMPYGPFTELEGQSPKQIQEAALLLDLRWSRRINTSYLELFERIKGHLSLTFDDLSFDNFKGLVVKMEDLGIKAGDRDMNQEER